MSHNRVVLMFSGSKLVESFLSDKKILRKDGKIIISLIMCQKKCLTLHFVRQKRVHVVCAHKRLNNERELNEMG